MTLRGVSGPTKRVGKYDFEVRTDGFGTMTDDEVFEYKSQRSDRYALPRILERLTEMDERIKALEGVKVSRE